jgi:putative cardiolipin synthase
MFARLATFVLAALVAGCASLPPLDGRVESRALADTSATRLGRAIAPEVAAHGGRSGVYPLPSPADAFAARAFLAFTAERSLDVQYYMWHDDETGVLLLEALWRAAERGVRVRLLLDDIDTSRFDAQLAAFDAHPGVEVRLYNPFPNRSMRALDFMSDFARVNRRMHNKSFTADNQAAIVGGRNVGNEYYGAGEGVEFTDLDIIAVGPIVRDVSDAFDLYWNSASAYPAASIVAPAPADARAKLEATFAATRADPDATVYLQALRESPDVRALLAEKLPFEWVEARLVRDEPRKTLDTTDDRSLLLLASLLPAIGEPQTSFDLVSPYFVPGERGTEVLTSLAKRGVRVRILTNSLAATDVGPVHAGYAKRREELLRAGVRLYEFKPAAAPLPTQSKKGIAGSRAGSLHAKTFAIDGRRIFVGSFNFDPRSARLNTEMGVVIESRTLASRLVERLDNDLPRIAWEVRLRDDGALEWIDHGPAGEVRYSEEPESTAMRRAWIRGMSILPIDWLL